MSDNPFSAAASALGYAYQFRYSLVIALARLRRELGWQISIETADDVEIETQDGSELYQLKMRAPTTSLTNASSDLWKTLRIWSEGISSGRFDASGTVFVLVTTASVVPNSAASKLVAEPSARDALSAQVDLQRVAAESQNVALKAAFDAFLALTNAQRESMLSSVTVVGGGSDISELSGDLGDLCIAAVRREQLDPFMQRLEGWWFRRCVQQMTCPGSAGITAEELESFFTDLRDQFRATNLPIDWDIDLVVSGDEDLHDRRFVQQLRLLSISDKRVGFAVRDYLRAFTQRSRWTRDGLLLVGELDRYERKLIEEWSRSFERRVDELGADAAEEQRVSMAQALYAWVESEADFPIRQECSEPFVTRGTYQMLSDDLRVGWHPDFLLRLLNILQPVGEDA